MNPAIKVEGKIFNKLFILILFISFFLFYFITSGMLQSAGAFDEFDILFEMDTPRAIEDMTVLREDHSRTRVHPLYVLMVNPLGNLLARFTGSGVLAARVINSAVGALGVALAYAFFLRLGRKPLDALILASLFGMTTSQYFLSAIPDTHSLAVVSLVLAYGLFFSALKEKKIHFLKWFVAGLFTLGVTTTNFAQAGILFFIACFNAYDGKKLIRAVLQSALYGLAVLAGAVLLALIQKAMYPTTALFFLPASFAGELDYASPLVLQQTRFVLSHLARTFLLINITAPAPRFFTIPGLENPAVTFAASGNYSFIGWVALAFWVGLLLFNAGKILLRKKRFLFYIGLGACLAFNFLLHAFYGVTPDRIELFLYTGNLTFLVLTPLAEGYLPDREKLFRAALVILTISLAINNYGAMRAIIQAMAG